MDAPFPLTELMADRRPSHALGIIALNWAVILLIIGLAWRIHTWPVFVLAFVLIAAQQHGLSLWLHEGAHWLLTRDKKWNDRITDLLLAKPLFVNLSSYRPRHFQHHAHLGEEQDTKQVIFERISGWQAVAFGAKALFGIRFVRMAFEYVRPSGSRTVPPSRAQMLRDWATLLLVQAVLFVTIALISDWTMYFLLWMLPFMTCFQLLAGLRAIIEHQPSGADQHPYIRVMAASPVDRLFFSRAGFEYHMEHHHFPNVPCYHLPKLRDNADARPVSYVGTLIALIRNG